MTSTTIDTTIDPVTAAQQIADKAANQRRSVEQQLQEAQERLAQAEQERTQLIAAVQTRLAQLNTAESHATIAEQEAELAKRLAELAVDTLGAHQAIDGANKAEKASRDAKQALERVRTEVTQQNEQDAARLAELGKEIAELHTIIDGAGPRLAEIAQLEKLTLHRLGEALHEAFLREAAEHERQENEARAALVEAQMGRHIFLIKKLDELAAWPDLQESVLKQLPAVDDETSRILRSTISHLDVLIHNRLGLKPYLLESPETARHMRWWDLLHVGHETFNAAVPLNSRHSAQALQFKRDTLAHVLADYERAKRGAR
jgi:hypothetical protein